MTSDTDIFERESIEPQTVTRTITEPLIEEFAAVSGDRNPLHLDEDAAEDGPFGERVAHGMLTASFISAALAKLDGEVIYLKQDLKFFAPVFIGDTLTAEVKPAKPYSDEKTTLWTTVTNQDGDTVVKGEAVVQVKD